MILVKSVMLVLKDIYILKKQNILQLPRILYVSLCIPRVGHVALFPMTKEHVKY